MRMLRPWLPRPAKLWDCYRSEDAAQIVEFALSLPLLVVFVVGIFDFSGALTLKQKLTNAAREGARVAASDPANDLSNGSSGALPVSVSDAFQVVDSYLVAEKVNDCGLLTDKPTLSTALTWVSTATGCPSVAPNALVLTISRGFVTSQKLGSEKASTDLVNTQIQIQYAYKWRFNSVITVLVPTARYTGVTYITTSATEFNEN